MQNNSTRTETNLKLDDSSGENAELEHLAANYRKFKFEHWVREVRNPATTSAEKLRRIVSRNRHATADYQVAKLKDDRWAITMHMSYRTGLGQGSPWQAYASKDACIDAFYREADRFFSEKQSSKLQEDARLQMLEVLSHRTNLFGIIEPPQVDE